MLTKDNLKAFKKMVNELTSLNLVSQNTPHLTIFYEDGLYGFLQYTDKPIGVQFRKWLRREVLPEIRQTGAYIADKANPAVLRSKINSELKTLNAVNETANNILHILGQAGMQTHTKALVLQQLYRKAGLDLPVSGPPAETSTPAGPPAIPSNRRPYKVDTVIQELEFLKSIKLMLERKGIEYTLRQLDHMIRLVHK